MFSGTIRLNVDPTDEHTDGELRDVLDRVGLGAVALDTVVVDSGANFSVGERQVRESFRVS